MIRDKRRTFDKVVKYSYQGAKVKDLGSESSTIVRALINPNKVKMDYDDKIISIGFEHGFTTGTVFEWINTGTKWICYLQDMTELAYFKGDIRRCKHKISWSDGDEIHSAYAAIRGPVETRIESISKVSLNVDIPNYSLNILLPLTNDTLKYFNRYSKFYLQGLNENDNFGSTCWRVEAKDSISTPGILEITAVEYYSNEFEDDIENGIAGGLIIEPTEEESLIEGEQFIRPKKTYSYTYKGNEDAKWEFDSKLPIETTIDNKTITLKWLQTYSGEIQVKYGKTELTIVVESLFG